jgi:hypothetical protein
MTIQKRRSLFLFSIPLLVMLLALDAVQLIVRLALDFLLMPLVVFRREFFLTNFHSFTAAFLNCFIWPGHTLIPVFIEDRHLLAFDEDAYCQYPECRVFENKITLLLAPTDLSGNMVIDALAACRPAETDFYGLTGLAYLETIDLNTAHLDQLLAEENFFHLLTTSDALKTYFCHKVKQLGQNTDAPYKYALLNVMIDFDDFFKMGTFHEMIPIEDDQQGVRRALIRGFEAATQSPAPISAIIAHLQLGDFYLACSGDGAATSEEKSKNYLKACEHYNAANIVEKRRLHPLQAAGLASHIKRACDFVLCASNEGLHGAMALLAQTPVTKQDGIAYDAVCTQIKGLGFFNVEAVHGGDHMNRVPLLSL